MTPNKATDAPHLDTVEAGTLMLNGKADMVANLICTTLLTRPAVRAYFERAAASATNGEVPAAAAEFNAMMVQVRDVTSIKVQPVDIELPASGA